MDIRRLDLEDVDTLHRFWEIGKAAEDAFRPYDAYVPWGSAVGHYTHPRTGFEDVLIGAFDGEQMLGRSFLRYPFRDNRHLGFAEFHVHPDHQRRGIGRALVQHLEDRVKADGRRVIMTEAYTPVDSDSAGLAFAEAMGYRRALEDAMKLVDLLDTEHTWAGLEAEALPRAAGYTFVSWQERVPDEHLAGFCALNEAYNDLAPSGGLELEPEVWDEDRVRQGEKQALATGRHVLAVAAIAPDGTMAGLTELVVNEHAPHRGFQSGTLVLPEHRGHALGLVMKLANHRAVRAAYPECRVLMTGNAGVNVAMNAVNERLGFREVERCVELQKELA